MSDGLGRQSLPGTAGVALKRIASKLLVAVTYPDLRDEAVRGACFALTPGNLSEPFYYRELWRSTGNRTWKLRDHFHATASQPLPQRVQQHEHPSLEYKKNGW